MMSATRSVCTPARRPAFIDGPHRPRPFSRRTLRAPHLMATAKYEGSPRETLGRKADAPEGNEELDSSDAMVGLF